MSIRPKMVVRQIVQITTFNFFFLNISHSRVSAWLPFVCLFFKGVFCWFRFGLGFGGSRGLGFGGLRFSVGRLEIFVFGGEVKQGTNTKSY